MSKPISEEILGFIQGYASGRRAREDEPANADAGSLHDEIRDRLSPALDNDAIYTDAVEEAVRRLMARRDEHEMIAEALERKANEVEFGKVVRALKMWPRTH